ncbi:MarR family winged helix-turn-helix transcriptional regulator [Sphingomonas sp. YR710]|uniref:MarR family winged helix-turn-helix transcriptional regulator n=1 Tax=Sphingomonas sp. YR710 TaxID=1882773 RepID=UPI0015A27AAA|nr:MarR family transcriptional regulator [Sphingomonas sp. YR710]
MLSRQLWLNFDQGVERAGLTRAKWSLIAAVARAPGTTQRVIATMLQVTEVTAGRMIDRLCADGYLERREDPQDRRAYRVHLTPAARPVLDQMSQTATIHTNAAFAGLEEEDLAKLEDILEIMSKNIAMFNQRMNQKNARAVRESANSEPEQLRGSPALK